MGAWTAFVWMASTSSASSRGFCSGMSEMSGARCLPTDWEAGRLVAISWVSVSRLGASLTTRLGLVALAAVSHLVAPPVLALMPPTDVGRQVQVSVDEGQLWCFDL